MRAGCECNVVIATCPQHDLESTFLRCDNVAFTTLPQPKHNVATTLSQRDFVCWDVCIEWLELYVLVYVALARGKPNTSLKLPGYTQQTKSRCDNVVATLCFGCGNVVNATLSQRKNVDSKSCCGHVAITTLHSQPARIFMHTHIHTHIHRI